MLLAQAILPCVNDFGQVPQTQNGSISFPYICARIFNFKLAHAKIEIVGEYLLPNDAKMYRINL